MRALVVGAGIAGLAAARAIVQAGHEVQVLEGAPALRAGAGAVTVFSNGFAALSGLGVDVADLGGGIERMDFRTATGARLARVDLSPLRRATGFPIRCVPRAALLERLAARLPSHTVRFDSRVVFGRTAGGVVQLTDAHGTSHTADFIVGADGHRSAMRRAFIDERPARQTGWVTWQGLGRLLPEVAGSACGIFRVGGQGFAGFMPAGEGLVLWWFDMPAQSLPAGDPSAAHLYQRFGDYPEPVGELLAAIEDDDITSFAHVLHRVPRPTGVAPVTLVGDAAHAFPPTQAQGANQAMEDALVLDQMLRKRSGLVQALRGYEVARRPHLRRVSRLAASESTNRLPVAPLRLAQAALPPTLAGRGYLALLKSWSNVL